MRVSLLYLCFFCLLPVAGHTLEAGVAVFDSNRKFIGSAVRIGPIGIQAPAGEHYYMTASHVVENQSTFFVGQTSGKLVMVNLNFDFALIATSAPLWPSIGRSLQTFSRPLVNKFSMAPSTFHLPSQKRNEDRYVLRIDGIDPQTLQPRNQTIVSPIVRTSFGGVPGRDQIGHLLQFEAPDIPGVSGSLVSVFYDEYSKKFQTEKDLVSNHCSVGAVCMGRFRPIPIAMITLVSPRMNTVLALPLESILQDLTYQLQHGFQTQFDRQLLPGGIRYLQSRIIHLRSDDITQSSLSLRAGIMAGVSRGGEGGVSRGGDGSQLNQSSFAWTSGILLPNDPRKRWLHTTSPQGFYWTEFEPFNEQLFLQNQDQIQGIFEFQGELYKSHIDASWPTWISERIAPRSAAPCRSLTSNVFIGESLALADQSTSSQLSVCEEKFANQKQVIRILRRSQHRSIEEARLEFSLGEQTPDGFKIQVMATAGPQRIPMVRQGLRTFEIPGELRLEIDFNSGLTLIKMTPRNVRFEFSPVGVVDDSRP